MISDKIAEGRLDPDLKAWAIQALRQAGIDGRDRPSVKDQAQALLDLMRRTVIYVPDATQAEVIPSPSATLCLRPGLCLGGEDCDGQVTALGAALLSIGLNVAVVKEDYPSLDAQSHVLLAVQDGNQWLYVDPSTKYPVSAQSMSPLDTLRTWINPLEGVPVEIVGLGHHPFGAPPPAPSPALIGANWTDVPDRSVKAGLRFALAVSVNMDWSEDDVRKALDPPMFIEVLERRTDFPDVNAWIVVGLARQDAVFNDTSDMHVSAVLQEQPPPVAPGPVPSPPTDPSQVPQAPPPQGVGFGTVVMGALGVAALGGLGYAWYSKRHRRLRA